MEKTREDLIKRHREWVDRCRADGKKFTENPCARCGEAQLFMVPDEPDQVYDSMRECVHCGYLFFGACDHWGNVTIVTPEEV